LHSDPNFELPQYHYTKNPYEENGSYDLNEILKRFETATKMADFYTGLWFALLGVLVGQVSSK
jgi:hypothetical protein